MGKPFKPSKKQRRVTRQGEMHPAYCHDQSTPLLRSREREERGRRLDAPSSLWSQCDWSLLAESMSAVTGFTRQGEDWTASFTYALQQLNRAIDRAGANVALGVPATLTDAPGWLVGHTINVNIANVRPTWLPFGDPYVVHAPDDMQSGEYAAWRERPALCHAEGADATVDRYLIRQWLTNIPHVPVFCDCGHTFTVTPMRAPGGMAWCIRCRRRHDIFCMEVEPDFSPPIPRVHIVNPAFFEALAARQGAVSA